MIVTEKTHQKNSDANESSFRVSHWLCWQRNGKTALMSAAAQAWLGRRIVWSPTGLTTRCARAYLSTRHMGYDSDCDIWYFDTCKSNRHKLTKDLSWGTGNSETGAMWDIRGPRYTEVVQVLLHHSADVNAQADNGYSALLWPGCNFRRDMSFWELILPSTAKPKRIIVW